jgi:hypothetical protein
VEERVSAKKQFSPCLAGRREAKTLARPAGFSPEFRENYYLRHILNDWNDWNVLNNWNEVLSCKS